MGTLGLGFFFFLNHLGNTTTDRIPMHCMFFLPSRFLVLFIRSCKKSDLMLHFVPSILESKKRSIAALHVGECESTRDEEGIYETTNKSGLLHTLEYENARFLHALPPFLVFDLIQLGLLISI